MRLQLLSAADPRPVPRPRLTKTQWHQSSDPLLMLKFVAGRASSRKLRLFTCSYSRHIWQQLSCPEARHVVEVVERLTDARASLADLEAANRLLAAVGWAWPQNWNDRWPAVVLA
jgi:hypothetical protein